MGTMILQFPWGGYNRTMQLPTFKLCEVSGQLGRENKFRVAGQMFPLRICETAQFKEEQGEESKINGGFVGVFVGTWQDVSGMRQADRRMYLPEQPGFPHR